MCINGDLDLINVINKVFSVACSLRHTHLGILALSPLCGNFDLNNVLCACVDSVVVHLNDIVALLAERSLSLFFHILDSVSLGNDLGKLEERGLENC